MRTYPKHLKPTKRNQRKMEKAIEAAKKAKQKEAALIEKYERIAAKQREKANQDWERAFKNVNPVAPTVQPPVKPAKPAQPTVQKPAKPVVPTVQPPVQAPAQKPVAAPPAPVVEWEEDEPEKRRGGVFFTVAGIIFLLIAIGMTLWQFGFLDKFLQKPVPDQPAASAVETSVEDV